jgi:biopolymer transport protein ExbD
MRKTLQKKTIEEPSVNLTPLIDVVFVILIMFIVIAPLLELDRIQLADAKTLTSSDSAVSVQESSQIAIHVHRDNTVWFLGKTVNIRQLQGILMEAKQKYPGARPQLFQDKEAHFGVYQSIKNAAENAGFDELDIILKPS